MNAERNAPVQRRTVALLCKYFRFVDCDAFALALRDLAHVEPMKPEHGESAQHEAE